MLHHGQRNARALGASFNEGGANQDAVDWRLHHLLHKLEEEVDNRKNSIAALESRIYQLETGKLEAYSPSSPERRVDVRDDATVPLKSANSMQETTTEISDEDEEEGCIASLMLSEGMEDVLADSYSFEESTWDAGVFAFVHSVGIGASFGMLLLQILNLVTQFVFLWIVNSYMCEDQMSDDFLLSLLRFRAGIAHHISYADVTTGRSLANQVCSQDERMPFAGTQVELMGDLESGRGGGVYLCLLVVLCWLITLTGEMDKSMRFAVAVFTLTKDAGCVGTRFVRTTEEGLSDIRLERVSKGRGVFIFITAVLPRLFIVVALAFVGIKFLVNTRCMSDLLLNALALAFIVDVDNMLYAAFAPNRLRSIVTRVAPVVFPKQQRRFVAMCLNTMVKVIVVFGALALAYWNQIRPYYGRMDQAYSILCKGETDFVYDLNTATNNVQVTRAFSEATDDWSPKELSVLSAARPPVWSGYGFELPEAVDGVLWKNQSASVVVKRSTSDLVSHLQHECHEHEGIVNFTEMEPSMALVQELESMQSMPLLDRVREQPCVDIHNRQLLSTFGENFTHCDNASHLCSEVSSTALRATCPQTCGCMTLINPTAGFFAGEGFGCPSQCWYGLMKQVRYVSSHDVDVPGMGKNNIPEGSEIGPSTPPLPGMRDRETERFCNDASPAAFSTTTALRNYFKGALRYFSSRSHKVEGLNLTIRSQVAGVMPVEIPRESSLEVVLSITNGSYLENILQGNWDLVPGTVHPRGLQGCQFWTSREVQWLFGIDFCATKQWRSLRPYCPRSCDCTNGMYQCPTSC